MNKIHVVVVVHTRYKNIKRWVDCWNECDKMEAQLTVIHNYYQESDIEGYRIMCEQAGVNYIARKNVGYDLGAFQDVCKERLDGFDNDWNILFWITDDTIIMRKDFLKMFTSQLSNEKVGIVCNEISKEVTTHVRTSGFAIRKKEALELEFPADPITTKQQCYFFEHLGGRKTLYHQIKNKGLQIIQPIALKNSAVWDTGHRAYLKRMDEHNLQFNPLSKSKITFICPAFNAYPQIVSSLLLQTHKNWNLLLIHDGKNTTGLEKMIEDIGDSRIEYYETEKRYGNWGHSIRQLALKAIKNRSMSHDSDFIVITNQDNYHVPVFCEFMLRGFKDPNIVASYCSQMVHSYIQWGVINCSMALGSVDCAGVMIKKEVACDVGWNDITGHSSDWTYFSEVMKKYGKGNFAKVDGCLLIHN